MNHKAIPVAAMLVAACLLLFGAALTAQAAPLACDATTGVPGAGECQITTAHAVTGPVEVDRTLHIFPTGRIDASGGGITLSICVAPAPVFSSCDLGLDTPSPLITPPAIGSGQIEANDVSGNDNASNITIAVSRDIRMSSNSAILAQNNVSGGHGGNIVVTASRNMTMNALAMISVSASGSAGNSPAGTITLNIGDTVGHTEGVFTMDATSKVLANSIGASAGQIAINAGLEMHFDGLVQSSSTLSGSGGQPPGGGPITIVSGCKLMVHDNGVISSEGRDPGADLVHLEGCEVTIWGLVQSIAPGAGHVPPTAPPNHCNYDQTAHPTILGANVYEGCVEIWGNTVTIDSTGTHKGKVNVAGIRTPGRAWIDILARRDITIIADTAVGNYSVNADACNGINAPNQPCSNSFAGLVNIKSQSGKVVMTALVPGTVGRAVSASAIATGGRAGRINVEAGGASGSGNVDFTADSLVALNNNSLVNGRIDAESFNDQVLGVSAGSLNTGAGGQVNLTACVGDPALTYAGTVTGTRTNAGPGVGCGGTPTFPTVANWKTGQTWSAFYATRATCDLSGCSVTCNASGQKFNDKNGNGAKDLPGDVGVPGLLMHIFDKATLGATYHQNVLTDALGNYTFTPPPGEYILCEQGGPAPFAPAQTFPPLPDGSNGLCAAHVGIPGSRGYDITLSVDVNSCSSTGNDFGNNFGATIGGQKFNDPTGNGVKDAGDPPIQGQQIHLFDKPGSGTPALDQHATTDVSGNFLFNNVPPGEYILCEQGGPAPNSPQQTFPAADGSAGACATHTTIAGSRGYDIVLVANQTSVNNDFGNFFGGSITGQKFNDLTGDGVKDASDPPVPGFVIHLLDKLTFGVVFHQIHLTDASGNFSFTLVPPGEYILCEAGGPAPNSPQQTYPATDGTAGACEAHLGFVGSRGYDIVLTANQNVVSQDFGNFFGGNISGQKFNDLTGNGVKDAGDPGVPGLQIHLFDKPGSGTPALHQHVTTDASGNYSFTAVPPGEYILCEQGGPTPNTPAQTFPSADGSGGRCTTHTTVAGSRGYDIVLTANQNSVNNDFGNFYGGTVSGQKFNDLAGNGVKDAGDPGVPGLQIHLFDKTTAGATYHQHAVTDASGNYSFANVPPGEYILCEQGGPAPNFPAQTFPAADGSGGRCATHTTIAGSRGYDLVLTANQNSVNNDFGNVFGGTITGQKFEDVNGDGIKDPGDPGLSGVQIHLFDKATGGANVHMHTTTAAGGNYSFSVQPGEYIVCEQGGPPQQTFPVTDGSGGACATHTGIAGSRGYDIVVTSNQVTGGRDFGNHFTPPPPPPMIPTLNEYALMALASLLGLAGMMAAGRRRGRRPIAR